MCLRILYSSSCYRKQKYSPKDTERASMMILTQEILKMLRDRKTLLATVRCQHAPVARVLKLSLNIGWRQEAGLKETIRNRWDLGCADSSGRKVLAETTENAIAIAWELIMWYKGGGQGPETGGPGTLLASHSVWISDFRFSKRSCLNNMVEKPLRRTSRS